MIKLNAKYLLLINFSDVKTIYYVEVNNNLVSKIGFVMVAYCQFKLVQAFF